MRLHWPVVVLFITLMGWWAWVAGALVAVAVYLGVLAVPLVPIFLWAYWHDRRADRRRDSCGATPES